MAPSAEKDTFQADTDFLFHLLTTTDELKLNWETVASATGISAYKNASKAVHEKRKIEETAEAGDEDSNAAGETGMNEKDSNEIGEQGGQGGLRASETIMATLLNGFQPIHQRGKTAFHQIFEELPTMVPLKDIDSGSTNDIQTLLIMLSSCGELSLDTKALAAAFGIARTDNALRKVKQVFAKHGYKFDSKTVTRIEGDGSGEIASVGTPKKTPAKPSRATETPASKKRKLKKADSEEHEEEEVAEAGKGGEARLEIEEEVV